MRLDGSVILITGASAGIGEEFARQLAPRAAHLVLVARRTERLEKLGAELRKAHPALATTVLPCDLGEPDAAERLFGEVTGLGLTVDVLINNAGMGDVGLFERADWKKLDQMLRLNVVALTHLTWKFLAPMLARKRGGILMVSSTASIQTLPGFGAYSATKYYVRGLSEALRAEVASSGIVITELRPGPVRTEFAEVATGGGALKVPAFTEISAEKCVCEALAGFERGRAVVLPGAIARLQSWIHRLIPAPVIAWVLRWLGRKIRNSASVSP